MNTLNMPGFTAETSLYKTDNHYVQTAYGGVLTDGSTTVVPQGDCPWWKFAGCIVAVGGCTAGCVISGPTFPVCLGLCLGAAGAIGCIACAGLNAQDEMTATQAALGGGGGDGGGGGGGGGSSGGPCGCPRGTRCCGGCTKVPGQGLVCNDVCIKPGEVCP